MTPASIVAEPPDDLSDAAIRTDAVKRFLLILAGILALLGVIVDLRLAVFVALAGAGRLALHYLSISPSALKTSTAAQVAFALWHIPRLLRFGGNVTLAGLLYTAALAGAIWWMHERNGFASASLLLGLHLYVAGSMIFTMHSLARGLVTIREFPDAGRYVGHFCVTGALCVLTIRALTANARDWALILDVSEQLGEIARNFTRELIAIVNRPRPI